MMPLRRCIGHAEVGKDCGPSRRPFSVIHRSQHSAKTRSSSETRTLVLGINSAGANGPEIDSRSYPAGGPAFTFPIASQSAALVWVGFKN